MGNQTYGREGEQLAVRYLKNNGYHIIKTNYKTNFGEIDIICQKDGFTIFVEVKRRASLKMGNPSEAVNFNKQMHIIRSAYVYATKTKSHETPMRFDVIDIVKDEITQYMDAFQVPNGFSFI